ncbi:MAG TPA: hypothetical protein VFY71_16835 [Planctomycetota bacterium]|nr:hypothetical protein [Planctomycetota bacterium]
MPQRWSEQTVLFDNGKYSVITGKYDGEWALGERWNGEPERVGFPSQGGNPLWHVVPDFLALPVLHGLLDELAKTPGAQAGRFASLVAQEIIEWHKA